MSQKIEQLEELRQDLENLIERLADLAPDPARRAPPSKPKEPTDDTKLAQNYRDQSTDEMMGVYIARILATSVGESSERLSSDEQDICMSTLHSAAKDMDTLLDACIDNLQRTADSAN